MPRLAEHLSRILPINRILTRPADLAAYDSDAQTAYRCRGLAVVIPHSTDELVAVVRWCHAENVPFVVRGSGTGLSAGATPIAEGVVIVTTSLNRIRTIDPTQRVAVVESGVVNAEVSRAAAAHGLFFAPDPSSQPICTIGGNIGFNAGGAHCLKYGMTSNHVLGLTAVLGTGEVVSWGGASRDHVGPDWTGLFVGNEGLFGVALEATLNLMPIPDGCHTVLAGFDSIEAAGEAVSAIIGSGLVPVAMELMDELTIEAVKPVVPIDYPPGCHALLLVELDGPKAIVEAERTHLEALLKAHHSTGLVIARNAQERANIWRVRKSAFSAYGRFAPNNFVQDSVVPRRHMGEALRRVKKIAEQADLCCPVVCHAGDGNLHPNLLYDGEHPGALRRAENAATEILRMSVELGGSITGEHGVGLEKRDFLPLMYNPAEISLFRQLQQCFDPAGIANPGKMLPVSTQHDPVERPPCDPRITTLADTLKTGEPGQPFGGGTKSIWPSPAPRKISTQTLRGIVAYEPTEFVLTALAGTPLTEIFATLTEHRQQLLFDPPFVAAGCTLGGAIASGLNGPGAFGRGRIRDSVLGATLIDGRGELLTLGARVVKNVAGFDLPKLLVGSLGALGVLAEITLKVGPAAPASETLQITATDSTQLHQCLQSLATRPARPIAIEASPADLRIWARFEAPVDALPSLTADLKTAGAETLSPAEAQALWAGLTEFSWARENDTWVKIATTLNQLPELFALVTVADPTTRIHASLGGDVVYLSIPSLNETKVRTHLAQSGYPTLAFRGSSRSLISAALASAVSRSIKRLFDPENRLPPLPNHQA